jgi:hypothetical protein
MPFANALSIRPARTARLAAMAGIIAIALILCGVVVLTAINLRKTSDGVDRLSRTTQVGDAYSQTTIAIALASVYADAYRRTGDPLAQQQMLGAIREAFLQVNKAKEAGSASDRTLMATLEARYGSELLNAVALLGWHRHVLLRIRPSTARQHCRGIRPAVRGCTLEGGTEPGAVSLPLRTPLNGRLCRLPAGAAGTRAPCST